MPLPARAPARIVCVRKSKRGKLPRGGAKDERVPPVCVGRLRCHRCVDGRKWCDRDGAGMQESRAARHALLRRGQRSRRRRADRSEKAARSFHAGIRLHARGGSGGLSERIQAAHRLSGSVYRQAGGLLPRAIELGRDRGDALRPSARRRILDRAHRIRRQYGRERFRSLPRAPRRDRKVTTSFRSSRRTAPTRSSPT